MDILQAIKERHSVRSFTDRAIDSEIENQLNQVIEQCNHDSGLNIQLVLNEPEAFDSMMAHYGKFINCKNYIAIVGKGKCSEAAGYYGEKIVLQAQMMGLNTCWVAMSYSKRKAKHICRAGEHLIIVIALGYGTTQGTPHKSKELNKVCRYDGTMPVWFKNGVESALLAPTAVNQQQFMLTLCGNKVKAEARMGFYASLDLGIVKYHFELGSENKDWDWA